MPLTIDGLSGSACLQALMPVISRSIDRRALVFAAFGLRALIYLDNSILILPAGSMC
jgi:hypothetical protein